MRLALNTSTRWTLSALLTAAGAALLSSHGLLAAIAPGRSAYLLGTALLLLIAGLLVVLWPREADPGETRKIRLLVVATTAGAGTVILWRVATELLTAVFGGPLDSSRADMLVIMEHAIRRLLDGGNPYTVHRVPWDAPLTYGPLLWLPHLISYVLGFDFRVYTLVGQLFIPALCFLSAGVRLGQGHIWRGCVLFGLGAGAALHPGMRAFHQIGHLQVYWPVFAVLCLLLQQQRWTASAVCLGLLASARTPLVAFAPAFFLYLHVRGVLTLRHAAVFVAALSLPYVPFLIADPAAVKDGMLDTYVRVMKTYVWRSTTWAVDTYGITGRLLERGQQQYVEIAQFLSLSIVYVCGWRAMKRGCRLEPWLALALVVFAMTTLWSVVYLYYDVWLFLTCALMAYDGSWRIPVPERPARTLALAFAACFAVVLGAAAVKPGPSFTLDIGSPAVNGYTGGGFGADVPAEEDGRVGVWIEGANARVRLPRAGWAGGTIRVVLKPHIAYPGARQAVIAQLNGHVLGQAFLKEGWQEISFPSRRRHWLYGFNVLDLQFSYAAPRHGGEAPPDARSQEYSAVIDSVSVE